MEFDFNINLLFLDLITKIDNTLNVSRDRSLNMEPYRRNIAFAIDKMGEASSKAQNLPSVITSAKRLQYSDHHLYVLKDPEANDHKGALVGILKVGTKKLFIYDLQGNHHEMEPLCILDFYVHESRQRQGCGKMLFEYMLRTENTQPNHLAIDRPSPKFSAFLKKHYNLKDAIPQMNNFVVYNSFFRDRRDLPHRRNARSAISISRQPLGFSSRQDKDFSVFNGNTGRPIFTESKNNNSSIITNDLKHLPQMQQIHHRDYLTANNLQSKTRHLPQDTVIDNIEKALEGITYRNQNRLQTNQRDPPPLRRDGPSSDYKDLYSQLQRPEQRQNKPPLPASYSDNQITRNEQLSTQNNTNQMKRDAPHFSTLSQPVDPRQVGARPSTISGDYTYNVGIQRHHSHTRLW